MKRNIILMIAFLSILMTTKAQKTTDLGMNYQAVARDASGQILANKNIQMRAKLLIEGPEGKVVYSEIHELTTSELGLFNIIIGQGDSKGEDFANVPWSEKNIWLEMAIADEEDRDFTVLGASQLLAVPYAYHAGSAETIHFHQDEAEKRRCRITGLPFWSILGNSNVSDTCHFIGTTIDVDLVFKTNDVERMRIRADGAVEIDNNLFVGGNLTVEGDGMFFNLVVENNLDVGKDGTFGQNLTVINETSTNTLDVTSNAAIGGNANVGGTANIDGNTSIGGNATVAGNTTIDQNTNIGGDVDVTGNASIGGDATVEGQLNAKGRMVVDGGADGSQSEQDSYPLLVKGSKQGIAIEVNSAAASNLESGRGNNYVSFWENDAMTGRIEGMNTADLDPTGLVSLIRTLVTNPPSGVSYNFAPITFPVPQVDVDVDVDWGIFLDVDVDVGFPGVNVGDPFNNLSQELLGYIQNPTGGPANLIWTQFTNIACDPNTGIFTQTLGPEAATNLKSQIFSNYTLDILTNSIAVFGSIAELVVSAASVLDPEDIVNEAIDVVVDITNLVIIGSYADVNLGVAYESGSGDYAEWLQRADIQEQLHYGDVVGVIGGKVSKKFTHADRFMVISASPIVLGNMPRNEVAEANSEKIAFMGQVPVKVRGVVNIGDYLLPSGEGDGLAIAVSPNKMKARDYQRIIGVAWEASDGSEFFKLVNTAVGLNQNDTGKMIEELQMVVNQMQKALQEVNPEYQAHFFDVDESGLAQQVELDYSVGPTHPTKLNGHFTEKQYTDRTELLADVKHILSNEANINLEQYPLVAYILDHPEQAEELRAFYKYFENGVRTIVAEQ